MIILINGGKRMPSSTELEAIESACGTKGWQSIDLAQGDAELTEEEQAELGEAVFSFITKRARAIWNERKVHTNYLLSEIRRAG